MSLFNIFVLTLNGQESRRQALVDALATNGLEYRLHFGIDGRTGLPSQQERFVDRPAILKNLGRPMTDGEIACALSHRDIYDTIISENLESVIILEDDAIIGNDFVEFASNQMPNWADFIMLDHWICRVWPFSVVRLSATHNAYPLAFNPSLANGYALGLGAAAHLLDMCTPIRLTADWPGDITAFRSYAAEPRIVDHPPLSDKNSLLEQKRQTLISGFMKRRDNRRFFRRDYWRRWPSKHLSRRIS